MEFLTISTYDCAKNVKDCTFATVPNSVLYIWTSILVLFYYFIIDGYTLENILKCSIPLTITSYEEIFLQDL